MDWMDVEICRVHAIRGASEDELVRSLLTHGLGLQDGLLWTGNFGTGEENST